MKRLSAAAVLLCVVMCPFVLGQSTAGTIGGTVEDATGALIPGVTVIATNTGTGVAATTLTNESGVYQFANLQSGTYRVEAALSGFRTQAYNNVDLVSSGQLRLNSGPVDDLQAYDVPG